MHRREEDFPNAEEFRPERYLKGKTKPYPNESGHSAFGHGKRACSGRPLAIQGLTITVTRLLWAFNILPGLDAQVRTSICEILGLIASIGKVAQTGFGSPTSFQSSRKHSTEAIQAAAVAKD